MSCVVVAAAATVLILNNAPHGAEHIRDVLVGQLLSVEARDVLRLALLYAVLGLLHVLWRTPLLEISRDPAAARAALSEPPCGFEKGSAGGAPGRGIWYLRRE